MPSSCPKTSNIGCVLSYWVGGGRGERNRELDVLVMSLIVEKTKVSPVLDFTPKFVADLENVIQDVF